jgi:hypothetical protein
MDSFTATFTVKDASALVTMQGALDEDTDLENLNLKPYREIRFDLHGIQHINSVGARSWIHWVSNFDRSKKYSLSNCPTVFVNQANLILGIVPEWMGVESFELPYYCEHCSHSFGVMLELASSRVVPEDVPETAKCKKCGLLAELDTFPEKYFQFLQRK